MSHIINDSLITESVVIQGHWLKTKYQNYVCLSYFLHYVK